MTGELIGHLGSPAARAAAVARIAVLAGAQAAAGTQPGAARGWVHAHGHAAGHDVRIFTPIEHTP